MLFPLLFFLFLFGRRMLPLCFWFWSMTNLSRSGNPVDMSKYYPRVSNWVANCVCTVYRMETGLIVVRYAPTPPEIFPQDWSPNLVSLFVAGQQGSGTESNVVKAIGDRIGSKPKDRWRLTRVHSAEGIEKKINPLLRGWGWWWRWWCGYYMKPGKNMTLGINPILC